MSNSCMSPRTGAPDRRCTEGFGPCALRADGAGRSPRVSRVVRPLPVPGPLPPREVFARDTEAATRRTCPIDYSGCRPCRVAWSATTLPATRLRAQDAGGTSFNDTALPREVRVAVALVRLYALPLTRIVEVTDDHIRHDQGHTYLTVNHHPFVLPLKLARLIDDQLQHRPAQQHGRVQIPLARSQPWRPAQPPRPRRHLETPRSACPRCTEHRHDGRLGRPAAHGHRRPTRHPPQDSRTLSHPRQRELVRLLGSATGRSTALAVEQGLRYWGMVSRMRPWPPPASTWSWALAMSSSG